MNLSFPLSVENSTFGGCWPDRTASSYALRRVRFKSTASRHVPALTLLSDQLDTIAAVVVGWAMKAEATQNASTFVGTVDEVGASTEGPFHHRWKRRQLYRAEIKFDTRNPMAAELGRAAFLYEARGVEERNM